MRYLCLFNEDTTVSSQLPPPMIWDSIEAANNYIREMKAAGKFTDGAFWAAGHGGFAIINANDAAELHTLIELSPARPFCKIETYPLLETDEFQPVFTKIKAQAKAGFEKYQSMMNKK